MLGDVVPPVLLGVGLVGPVEHELAVEVAVVGELLDTGVRKVQRLVRVHGHEDLHELHDARREDALAGVLLDLHDGVAHIDAAALELDVDDRHAVDEQHHVATPLRKDALLRLEARLDGDLVAGAPARDLVAAVDAQGHLGAVVQRVHRVVALDDDVAPVDEAVHVGSRILGVHLLQDLAHLRVGERAPVQVVLVVVVGEEDVRPVPDEVLLGRVTQNPVSPALLLGERLDERGLEVGLILERGKHYADSLHEHLAKQRGLDAFEHFKLTLMKGDEVVEALKSIGN